MSRGMVRAVWVMAVVAVAASARAENWAEALFSEKGHDFGPVARGAKVRHHFVLTNRTGEAVTIADIRASCGCTAGRAGAATVAPGQATTIEAEMDTRNFVGKKATTLTVALLTAGGRQAEVRLPIVTTILSDIVLNPGTLEFGSVARGRGAKRQLTIERVGMPTWKVERMVAPGRLSQVIDAQIVESERKGERVTYLLTANLRPDAPAGPLREEIRVLTNDPESPSVPVLVTAQVRGDLSASPSVLALGKVASAGGVKGRFLVRGTKPFAIRAIEGAGDGFQAVADDSARKPLHIVTVSYAPEEGTSRGDLRRTFRVLTDLPGEPALELTATLHVDP